MSNRPKVRPVKLRGRAEQQAIAQEIMNEALIMQQLKKFPAFREFLELHFTIGFTNDGPTGMPMPIVTPKPIEKKEEKLVIL